MENSKSFELLVSSGDTKEEQILEALRATPSCNA